MKRNTQKLVAFLLTAVLATGIIPSETWASEVSLPEANGTVVTEQAQSVPSEDTFSDTDNSENIAESGNENPGSVVSAEDTTGSGADAENAGAEDPAGADVDASETPAGADSAGTEQPHTDTVDAGESTAPETPAVEETDSMADAAAEKEGELSEAASDESETASEDTEPAKEEDAGTAAGHLQAVLHEEDEEKKITVTISGAPEGAAVTVGEAPEAVWKAPVEQAMQPVSENPEVPESSERMLITVDTDTAEVQLITADTGNAEEAGLPEDTAEDTMPAYRTLVALDISVEGIETCTSDLTVTVEGKPLAGVTGTSVLYHINKQNTAEIISCTPDPEKQTITFHTREFSPFVLIQPEEENTAKPETTVRKKGRAKAPASGNTDPWYIEDGKLIIQDDSAMSFSSAASAPWHAQRAEITSIEIRDGVTKIPTNFVNSGSTGSPAYPNLKSVSIADTVTTMGDWAFGYCTGLEEITMGTGLKTIGKAAFYQ